MVLARRSLSEGTENSDICSSLHDCFFLFFSSSEQKVDRLDSRALMSNDYTQSHDSVGLGGGLPNAGALWLRTRTSGRLTSCVRE